jgi:DNA-binding NtrC family response regulator
VNVKLAVEEGFYFSAPKNRNFETKFKTFNAPMNVSVTHAIGSKPARVAVIADNAQGPIDVFLDSLYTGVFDVRTKEAKAQVLQSFVSNSSSNRDGNDGKHELHFARKSKEQTRGWIGDSRRPEQFDRNKLSRVELTNSLAPVRLHVARLKPSTAVRR